MSFAALAWAAKQRPGNLAAKMVLLGLANFADEHGCAYPSTAALAEFGDMDHKTATVALDKLVALKLIADSGEREGRTKQIKVYRLALESLPKVEAFQKRKPPVSPPKDPQKRGTDTVMEPVPEKDKPSLDIRARKKRKPKWVRPDDIPAEEWEGFEEMRRKIGKDMTDRARNLAVNRLRALAEDGWPPGVVLNHCTLNSYQGIFPPRHENGRQPNSGQPVSLRGTRPDPSLDFVRQANADLAAERRSAPDHRGDRPALPSFGPS